MDVNAAVAAVAALAGVCTGVIAMLAFRWSEREQSRPTRTALHIDPAVLPPGVDTVLSVLRSSAVVLDEGKTSHGWAETEENRRLDDEEAELEARIEKIREARAALVDRWRKEHPSGEELPF